MAMQLAPGDNKENESLGNTKVVRNHGRAPDNPQQDPAESPVSPSKPFPSTPATRLPLADLIGDVEERRTRNPTTEVSPEDQIQWHAARSPLSSNSKTTPAPRGKKRARSSSPPGSSQRLKKAALDLQELKQSLKTPQMDPSIDLWNRYACGSDNETPLGQQIASLAHFISSSSPHGKEDQAGNVSGLRRWTSCGVEFPSSKGKRKPVRPSSVKTHLADVFNDLPDGNAEEQEDSPKTSKIGNLLEKIQQSLAQAKQSEEEQKGPSSSSPLPERQEGFDRQSISPCRASELAARQNGTRTSQEHISEQLAASKNTLAGNFKKPSSSSFGSDEMDSAFLDVVVQPGVGTTLRSTQPQPNQTRNAYKSDQAAGPSDVDRDSVKDEFGGDIDLDEADFEVVASMYDRRVTDSSSGRQVFGTAEEQKVPLALGAIGEEDDFGDDDVDEESFAAAEFSATQSASALRHSGHSKTSHHRPERHTIQRYLVKDVYESQFTNTRGQTRPEKVLRVEEESSKLEKAISLRDSWFDTLCTKGSYVHVIGEFSSTGQCTVDDLQNILILHPDHLMSALVVADSFSCTRKAVLQDRVKATSDASPPQLYGTILHEIFQEAIQANRWDDGFLNDTIATIVARHIEDLYQTHLSIEQATDHLQSKMPELQAWAELFVKLKPRDDATVKDRNGKSVTMSVNKLLDVEEHVWSPMYGLKGNIDATVQVTMRDDDGERTLTVPLELKTGKYSSNASHRAQTALYTLLLSDRYDVAVAYGILYYIETSEVSRIPAIRHELLHMIVQRNELACYVRERLSLPPMLRQTHTCNRCYAKVPCFLYHKLAEDGDGETSGLRDKFDAVTKHLTPAHAEFFKKWDELLTAEESEMMKFRRELWTMLSHEREKLGRCFANVTLVSGGSSEEAGSSKINRFTYAFEKLQESSVFSFNESQITVGEPIVISDEKGHYALAKGYVTAITKSRISVAVDRRLHNARSRQPGFDACSNQSFAALMEVGVERPKQNVEASQARPLLYRLDKDEFSNGMATVRNNLIQVMTKDVFHARDIRELVVDNIAPKFRPSASAISISGPASQLSINEDQRAAIEKIMSAEDYALVLGMPGTGKTTTIANIIRALVARGKSVLLTSYTHTAVDNILLKIRQDNIGVLRLGALAKIHPEVREFASLAAEPKTTIEGLQRAYHDPPVVATTCLGISHAIFSERTFDYCIVDEASQITLPVCLGPIRMARTFVLVGDHYQLPPLVQNRKAQEGGLDVSLFKLLSERHPESVAMLRNQYRMNEAIMRLSNTLIYDGRLRCGSEAVATRTLDLPGLSVLTDAHHPIPSPTQCPGATSPSCWLNLTLSLASPPVIFLDTDPLLPASRETASGARITNTLEATLIAQLTQTLLASGLAPSSLGIITLYRSQLALIKTLLPPSATPVEAHTADRFQGRDKDVVLLSCVRSNERDAVGDLLKDWRRVNVAITRARRKLVIVGSRGTLARGDELLARLVALCEANGQVVNLPLSAGVEDGHCWDAVRASATPAPVADVKSSSRTAEPTEVVSRAGDAAHTAPKPDRNKQKPFKVPAKVARLSGKAAAASLGTTGGAGAVRGRSRPVLADIINDVVGEDFFSSASPF